MFLLLVSSGQECIDGGPVSCEGVEVVVAARQNWDEGDSEDARSELLALMEGNDFVLFAVNQQRRAADERGVEVGADWVTNKKSWCPAEELSGEALNAVVGALQDEATGLLNGGEADGEACADRPAVDDDLLFVSVLLELRGFVDCGGGFAQAFLRRDTSLTVRDDPALLEGPCELKAEVGRQSLENEHQALLESKEREQDQPIEPGSNKQCDGRQPHERRSRDSTHA